MSLLGADARHILETEKRLLRRVDWSVTGGNRAGCARRVMFESRVNMKSTVPRGVWFRASLIPQFADSATFQLECESPGAKARIPLFRLDWRPMGVHRNGGLGPPELRGLFIEAGVTHVHSCLDHIDEETGELGSGSLTARVVSPDFDSYDAALIWFCEKTRILNLGDIPPPPTQGELL
jgi:hypothetical protein